MSSGEKSLLQIFLRLGIHMTGNTIVFIDEIETHLHTTWRFQLMFELMKMAQKHYPGFTLFVTTHTQEVMKAFAPQLTEKNLVKGAYILETAEEEAKAQRIMQEMREQLSAES
jgi:AAA15 family ATPase/GTPase